MKAGLLGIGLACSSVLWAQTPVDLTVLEVNMEEVATPEHIVELLNKRAMLQDQKAADLRSLYEWMGLEDGEIDFDTVINIGKKVWDVIVAGQPVLNERHSYANALPGGVSESTALQGFSSYQYQSYRLTSVNGFGMDVIDVVYTVAHRFGGGVQGRGQYLTDVTVIPSDIQVLWGYSLDVGVDNIRVANLGNTESPVAGMSLEMSVKVSTILQKNVTRRLFDFRGDSANSKLIR